VVVENPCVTSTPVRGVASVPVVAAPPVSLRDSQDSRGSRRERYLDALRALAIGRVVVYHAFGFVFLAYVFPAMGVMFALGGSLMAASLGRGGVARTVRSRVRRLVPSLWALGALVVPASLWLMWRDDPTAIPSADLLFWLVPVGQPGAVDALEPVTIVLWYLTTYLWLVLLSPLLLAAFRRWPLWTVLAPLAVLVVTQVAPHVDLTGGVGEVLVDVATFGACWVLGFAHRDGALRRLPRPVWLLCATGLLVAGAAWAVTHPGEGGTLDLNEIPLAQGLYSAGFTLLIMRATPSLSWLRRVRPLDWLVSAVNARAVTIYLWHNIALTASAPIADRVDVWRFGDRTGYLPTGVIVVLLIVGAVVAFGWVEDVAARRRPRLIPR
jgi:peptidoglycan/LPS O-acetylase OafA/YrhL